MLQGLFPVADNRAVGTVVADVGKRAILDAEVGLEYEPLIGSGKTAAHSTAAVHVSDAAEVLVAPCDQVAQQHHVVATVHLGRSLVAIPQFPNGGGAVLSHVAPRGIAVLGGYHIGNVAEPIVAEST